MTVRHDAFNPRDTHPDDPTKAEAATLSEDTKYWRNRAETARAKREYEEETAKQERAGNAPEAPFKVKGELNLGSIDFQKQQEELKQSIGVIQQEHEQKIERLQKDRDDYRDEVHKIQYEMMEKMMQARMDSLQKSLEQNAVRPKDKPFSEQLTEIESLATVLGFKKAAGDEKLPGELRLDILRLEMERDSRQREFERQMKQDERLWTLKLEEIKGNQAINAAKIEAERTRTSMFAQAPEVLGRAIAKGLIENQGQPSRPADRRAPKRTEKYHLEVPEGESGETQCPQCDGVVAVAPTAKTAVCPQCDLRIPIVRTMASGQVEEE